MRSCSHNAQLLSISSKTQRGIHFLCALQDYSIRFSFVPFEMIVESVCLCVCLNSLNIKCTSSHGKMSHSNAQHLDKNERRRKNLPQFGLKNENNKKATTNTEITSDIRLYIYMAFKMVTKTNSSAQFDARSIWFVLTANS